MPPCTTDKIESRRFRRRVIEADFSGAEPNSDGGPLLLRQVDRHLGLSRMAAAVIPDPHDPEFSVSASTSTARHAPKKNQIGLVTRKQNR